MTLIFTSTGNGLFLKMVLQKVFLGLVVIVFTRKKLFLWMCWNLISLNFSEEYILLQFTYKILPDNREMMTAFLLIVIEAIEEQNKRTHRAQFNWFFCAWCASCNLEERKSNKAHYHSWFFLPCFSTCFAIKTPLRSFKKKLCPFESHP